MNAIYKREMRAYFTSPLGYVFAAVFIAAAGFLFSYFTLQQAVSGSATQLSSFFTSVIFVMMILIPLLTMKSFSDDKKTRTEQLLLTSPVSLFSMVAAKFLAAYTTFAAAFLISCVNLFAVDLYGTPNSGVLFGYIIGILLLGAAFTAVGIFISSLTENQLVAAVATIAILLFMIIISFLSESLSSGALKEFVNWVSVYRRYYNFTYGVFDFAALFYYISICFAFLFLTVRVYEKRRWS